MSVKLIDNDSFYGYRARRYVDGATVQQYFSLMKSGKRVTGWEKDRILRAAESYDRNLERKQKETARDRQKELKHTSRAKSATGVRGISLRNKEYTKNGKTYSSLSFVVSCQSEVVGKPVGTSYSISSNGWQGAWEKAVKFLAKHKKIFRYRHLLDRIPQKPDDVDGMTETRH
ncbi:MAG: hypothetical protein D6B28_01735 [Gammaproteobacteria bacterium]|nr:MAG: hypothetical protein D6B28_01735 [Gammaproteobacteria bacterium]